MTDRYRHTIPATGLLSATMGRRALLKGTGLAVAGSMMGGLFGRSAFAQTADEALVAAAKAEGRLVLYTGSAEPLIISLAEAFKAEYGIQLEYQRLNSSDVASRYTAEAEAGKTIADVVMAGDPLLLEAFRAKGWLADLDPALVPGLADWPEQFRNDFSAVISINPQTMAVNTQLVAEPPTSWSDMLRPEFKGRMITQDLRSVGLVAFGAYDLLLREYGEDFLRDLGKQDFQLGSGGPASIQQVAAGAASLFFPCSTTQAYSMIDQGAPVAAVIPENEPCTGVLTPVAVSQNAQNPNAARLFSGFLLSQTGQVLLNAQTISPNSSPGTAPLPTYFVEPDMESAEENQQKIIELMGLA